MRVLSYDPGAARYGWSIIDGEPPVAPKYIASGIKGLHRGTEEQYQDYKLRLIKRVAEDTHYLIEAFEPDAIVLETLPVVNSGEWKGGAQRVLGQVMIASVATTAHLCGGLPVHQIAANTIKKRVGGHAKATKPKVRNGVIALLPFLESRKKEWTKVFDESDGIATGLAWLGYTTP